MINMIKGLDRRQKLCAHVAVGNFMAIEHIYGPDRHDDYLKDKADLEKLIEFEKCKTSEIMEEFCDDLIKKPITDDEIIKFHLNPSTNPADEDRENDHRSLAKQAAPTYAQMVANAVKQEAAKITKQQATSAGTTPEQPKKFGFKSDGRGKGKKCRTPSPPARGSAKSSSSKTDWHRKASARDRSPKESKRSDRSSPDFRQGQATLEQGKGGAHQRQETEIQRVSSKGTPEPQPQTRNEPGRQAEPEISSGVGTAMWRNREALITASTPTTSSSETILTGDCLPTVIVNSTVDITNSSNTSDPCSSKTLKDSDADPSKLYSTVCVPIDETADLNAALLFRLNNVKSYQRVLPSFTATQEQCAVVNLADFPLSEACRSLLSKGLNFCPTPEPVDMGELKRDLDDFHRKLKLRAHFQPSVATKAAPKPVGRQERVPPNRT